jgi:hypothetical protein
MTKKEFFSSRPLSEAGFSGLKDAQDFLSRYLVSPNPVYPKIL